MMCLSHCRLPFCDNTHTPSLAFGYSIVFTAWSALTNANLWLLNSQWRTQQRYPDQQNPAQEVAMSLLALSGHPHMSHLMSLCGLKQICLFALHMSAFDPKRT